MRKFSDDKIDLSPIFNVYSLREQRSAGMDKLTLEFKNRVRLSCIRMVHPYDHHSGAGRKIPDFWTILWDKLRYRHGRIELLEQYSSSSIAEIEQFLSECSDEHYLDFIEMFFQSKQLPMYFSDGELKEAVGNINEFFRQDDLPYSLTEFSISKSRTIGPGIRRLQSRLRRRSKRPTLPWLVSSDMQPISLPIRIPTIEAYPQIIRVENEVTHRAAIEPVLTLLSAPAFREANREFLDALAEYRKGDYRDCVTKCGSALESVLKIICEQKGWPVDRGAARLLNTVLRETNLPTFLNQPLSQTATIRNQLGSAHGAGAQPREVPEHLAQYTINLTASVILLLVEEANS